MAVKPEVAALTTQLEAQLLEAIDTVEHITGRNRFMEATIKVRLEKTLATLAAPYEDPRDTTVVITPGTPVEQPTPPSTGG